MPTLPYFRHLMPIKPSWSIPRGWFPSRLTYKVGNLAAMGRWNGGLSRCRVLNHPGSVIGDKHGLSHVPWQPQRLRGWGGRGLWPEIGGGAAACSSSGTDVPSAAARPASMGVFLCSTGRRVGGRSTIRDGRRYVDPARLIRWSVHESLVQAAALSGHEGSAGPVPLHRPARQTICGNVAAAAAR